MNVCAETGSRPSAVRQTEYEYPWGIGSVSRESGHAEGLLSPKLNTVVANSFLKQLAESLTTTIKPSWSGTVPASTAANH